MIITPPPNPTTSPERPDAWTDEVHEAAKQHTAEAYPHEAAGVVEGGKYVRLENRSGEPTKDIALSDADLLRVAQAEVFFHSHPDGIGCPSDSDMRYQQQLDIPFVVMCWPMYDVFWWGDELKPQPLVGRGFRHGVHDCYSLIRDYYFEKHNVRLMDGPRGWRWWAETNADIYREGFERAGFRQISVAEATRPGDGLLMPFRFKVPMHGAIVWDRDLILHHPAGAKPVDPTRLSSVDLRSRYIRQVTVALRYEGATDAA